jgi:HD-GYP domain-containing protein (c-di-GMP phosphodiesterase class II)
MPTDGEKLELYHRLMEVSHGIEERPVQTMDTTFETILEEATRRTGTIQAAIFVGDEDERVLRVSASLGLSSRFRDTVIIPYGMGITGKAVATREVGISTNLKTDERKLFKTDEEVGSVLAAPFRTGTGALNVYRPEASEFRPEQVRFITDIVDYCGLFVYAIYEHERAKYNALGSIRVMAKACEQKSRWTANHSEKVKVIAVKIASKLGMSWAKIREVALGAELHDIGKIGIPDYILDKEGSLDPGERERMRQHPNTGCELLGELIKVSPSYRYALPYIRDHHEFLDGSGYPNGKSREKLGIEARITAIADAAEAMTSLRPYQDPMPVEVMIEELLAYSKQEPINPMLRPLHRTLKRIKKEIIANPETLYGAAGYGSMEEMGASGLTYGFIMDSLSYTTLDEMLACERIPVIQGLMREYWVKDVGKGDHYDAGVVNKFRGSRPHLYITVERAV